jgi:hypothetical protein
MQATTRNRRGSIQSPLRLLLEKNTTAPRRSGTNSGGMTNGWMELLGLARAGVEEGVVGITMTLTETSLPGFRQPRRWTFRVMRRPKFALSGGMFRRLTLVVAALALFGCSDVSTRPEEGAVRPDTTQGPDTLTAPDTGGIAQRRLIECPTLQTSSNAGMIGVLGGTIAAAGTSIVLPAGSVLLGTLIRVTVPASTYMEVDVTANDLATFLFLKSVTITIDYSRCPASVIAGKTLTVWHINSQTKALIQNMNGVNDPVQRRISFTTDHLSGYAIAQ